MVTKRFQRPFSLATRLTFFISLATIASFFAFAWIMIHSVKVHFAEQDINDLKEISATLERILTHPDEPEARRLDNKKTSPLRALLSGVALAMNWRRSGEPGE